MGQLWFRFSYISQNKIFCLGIRYKVVQFLNFISNIFRAMRIRWSNNAQANVFHQFPFQPLYLQTGLSNQACMLHVQYEYVHQSSFSPCADKKLWIYYNLSSTDLLSEIILPQIYKEIISLIFIISSAWLQILFLHPAHSSGFRDFHSSVTPLATLGSIID